MCAVWVKWELNKLLSVAEAMLGGKQKQLDKITDLYRKNCKIYHFVFYHYERAISFYKKIKKKFSMTLQTL